jgi:hypothetical protein
MSEALENEVKAAGPNGRVIPVHSTKVDMDSAWDRTAQFKKMRSPASTGYYDDLFAFQLPNTDGDRKTHYTFIHHFVNSDGSPGAASMRALANSMAVLNGGRQGTVLRGAARQGVYRHIAAHYEDAGRDIPELKSDEDVNAIMMFKGLIDAPISEELDLTVKGLDGLDEIIDVESDVLWFEGSAEMKGIVVEADDDSALVEQVDEDGNRMGELYELDYAEIKLRTFTVVEKVDGEVESGAIVSWETSNGRYYGDVVAVETEGSLRGEPQGLELEGSEQNPVYLIRVWMQEMEDEGMEEEEPTDEEASLKSAKSAGEWTPTNVTVVARADALTVEGALPMGTTEEDYDDESEDEETAMKSIDQELSAKIQKVLKENAEILEQLSQIEAEEKAADISVGQNSEDAQVGSEEAVETEGAEAATEEVKSEDIEAVEVKSEEVTEEADSGAENDAEQQESEESDTVMSEDVVEEKASISFDELKEFHLLLKEFNK